MTHAQNPRTRCHTIAKERGRLAPAVLLGLLILTLSVLGASPARADHELAIYCEGHGGAFGASHYRDHDEGYILSTSGRYSFYPSSAYATLAANYHGSPSVYVSGGYFYPLQIGTGPVYEASGYFSIHTGRFGRTSLGLQIGIGSLPTIGFAYLSYEPPAVHTTVPRWHYRGDYVRRHAAPHLHYRGHHDQNLYHHRAGHKHHAKSHRPQFVQHHEKHHKWQRAVRHELKHPARVHDRRRRKHDTPGHPRHKYLRND